MMRRLVIVGAWLAAGAAIVAGLYWTLLNTPESNALTLSASAVLILAIVCASGLVVNAAVLLARGAVMREAIRGGARAIPWFVAAIAPALLIWWAVLRADAWTSRYSGEISAWFIARFGWSDISWLFTAEAWASRWLRFALAPIVMLCLLAALLADGRTALGSTRWLRRTLHWRTLGAATLVFIALFALPWQLTAWRPELPPTWVEPAVAALRLGVAALAIVIGSAVLVNVAAKPSVPANS
jgi:hypothetical protein